MKFLRRHWYDVSAVIGIATLTLLFVFWNEFSVLQRLTIANLAVIFFHFFEEFGFPGGFGKMANTVLYKNSPAPDRWPLNQNVVMIGNWAVAMLFYVPPVFFPQLIWLGLIPMLFGLILQGLGHGIITPIILKRAGLRYPYNAGMLTAFLGHVPLAIAYCYVVQTNNLATLWDWVIGLVSVPIVYLVIFRKLIMQPLEDKHSPWPFDEMELRHFDTLYRR